MNEFWWRPGKSGAPEQTARSRNFSWSLFSGCSPAVRRSRWYTANPSDVCLPRRRDTVSLLQRIQQTWSNNQHCWRLTRTFVSPVVEENHVVQDTPSLLPFCSEEAGVWTTRGESKRQQAQTACQLCKVSFSVWAPWLHWSRSYEKDESTAISWSCPNVVNTIHLTLHPT